MKIMAYILIFAGVMNIITGSASTKTPYNNPTEKIGFGILIAIGGVALLSRTKAKINPDKKEQTLNIDIYPIAMYSLIALILILTIYLVSNS